MGNFAGHAIPGAFFIVYGISWCLNSIWYHLRTKATQRVSGESRPKREKLASTSFFEFKRDNDLSKKGWIPLSFTRVPIEPIMKIILPALGVIMEAFFDLKMENGRRHLVLFVYSPWDSSGELGNVSGLHHITMYSLFMLSGVMDLLTLIVKLPRQTSMLFVSLAFTVEGLLFFFHTGGRDEFNVVVHSLLAYSIVACVIFTLSRIVNASNVVLNIFAGSSILLQGTWFIQAGYFLYGGFLHEQDKSSAHSYVMFVVVCYTWHVVLIALGNIVMWIFLSAALRGRVCHRWSVKRRGLLASLRHGLPGELDEEQNSLIVEEAKDGGESGIELQLMAQTRT